MQKWEYIVGINSASIIGEVKEAEEKLEFICNDEKFESSKDMLNKLGKSGWELVQIVINDFRQSTIQNYDPKRENIAYQMLFYFKRPLEKEKSKPAKAKAIKIKR